MREEMISGDVENIVGALTQALSRVPPAASGWRGARGGAGSVVTGPQFSAAQLQTQVGGTKNSSLRAPLGFGSFTFTATTGTEHNFLVEPQEAFRVERLVIETSTSPGPLVGIFPPVVGSLPQSPSVEFPIPAVMFRADATDAAMDWQICPAGTKIQVRAVLSGPLAAEEEITVQIGAYGTWIRG